MTKVFDSIIRMYRLRLLLVAVSIIAYARDIVYSSGEVEVFVLPGEATQVRFEGEVAGGFKKQASSVTVEKVGTDLIIFPQDNLPPDGESILVRLTDGTTYALRVKQAPDHSARDAIVSIKDSRAKITPADQDEFPKYRDRQFIYPTQYQVAGLMRELILATEFNKSNIPGYRVSELGAGQELVNNGQISAKLLRMYLGPQLWGYVLEARNLTNQAIKVDPAIFKINGTRAISLSNWELEPVASNNSKAFVYVITKAR